MSGLVFFGASVVLAFMVLTVHLHPQLKLTEIACASVPVGAVAGAWGFFIVAMLINFLSDEACTIGAVIMAVAFFAYLDAFLRTFRAGLAQFHTEVTTLKYLLPLMAVFAAVVVPLYSSRYLREDASGQVWTGGSTWADLPIHLHMANAFLHGRNRVVYFDGMHSPVFAGEFMKYPFIPDFHAAVMVKFGSSMHTAMWVPGAACFVAFVGLLFLLAQRVVRSRPAAALSVASVVFAGGFAGVRLWWARGISKTLAKDPIQDDVDANGEVFWFGCVPHVLIPQRGATFAYPVVVFILLLAWVAVANRARLQRSQHAGLLVTAGVLSGTLPLVQAHACIGIAMFVGAMFLLELYRCVLDAMPFLVSLGRNADAQDTAGAKSALFAMLSWAAAGVFALAEAWPQVRVLSSGMAGKGFFEVKPVIDGGVSGFVSMWWSALGPTVFLFFLSGALVFRRAFAAAAAARAAATPTSAAATTPPAGKGDSADNAAAAALSTQQAVWWLASAAVFAFGNFVLVSPWAKDNVKLLYIWLCGGMCFACDAMVRTFADAYEANAAGGAGGVAAPSGGNGRGPRTGAGKGANAKAAAFGPGTWVLAVVPAVIALMCFSGFLGLVRETQSHHVLYGPDEAAVGKWLIENTRTEAVVLHKDSHRAPSGMVAGRPSLVAYTGWMWSHGYDYHERHRDRDTVLKAITKAVDSDATYLLYRWGVKYVVHEAPTSKKEVLNQTYLDGHVKRVFQSNRYHVYRVRYDGEPF